MGKADGIEVANVTEVYRRDRVSVGSYDMLLFYTKRMTTRGGGQLSWSEEASRAQSVLYLFCPHFDVQVSHPPVSDGSFRWGLIGPRSVHGDARGVLRGIGSEGSHSRRTGVYVAPEEANESFEHVYLLGCWDLRM